MTLSQRIAAAGYTADDYRRRMEPAARVVLYYAK